ncbi:pseudouridine synthase [Persicobacter sp. CCB-QB2]|uniref:pseudouridine synthase n=1 Tax=Persicobacter sp. CCB-QB2 TaxID=1561025 RepID=UPI0006A95BD7|nr:pseudouridine synthase [Persicobacter sp. CCB-QB2]
MRLDKFLCQSTVLDRPTAHECIISERVKVGRAVITLPEAQVHPEEKVYLDDVLLKLRPFRYFLIHKPAQTVCSNKDEHYPSVFTTVGLEPENLHIVGRLDADTTGLVLATDDGQWSFLIMHPDYKCPKTYRVQLQKPIDAGAIEKLEKGVQLQGEKQATAPAKVEIIHEKEVLLTITEGKFHQVKRMFAVVKNKVVQLHRERIGPVELDMAEGSFRELTKKEVNLLVAEKNRPQKKK